jgi:hypothetical protein
MGVPAASHIGDVRPIAGDGIGQDCGIVEPRLEHLPTLLLDHARGRLPPVEASEIDRAIQLILKLVGNDAAGLPRRAVIGSMP